MSSPFCPPLLFRSSMTTAHDDLDLPDGMHVRVWLNPNFGVPLCPFVVTPFMPDHKPTPVGDMVAFDYRGNSVGFPFDPGGVGPVTMILNPPEIGGHDPWICWVMLDADSHEHLQLELLDFKGRLVGRRSEAPWVASGSNIAQIRIGGSGRVNGVLDFDASVGAHAPEGADPALELSLPYKTAKWYTGGLGDQAAADRAADGAPLRLPPRDDPGQPTPGDPEGIERDRIAAVAEILQPWLDGAFDQDNLPWDQTLPPDPAPGRKGRVEGPLLGAIWAAAADPGIARYLGMMGRIPQHLPNPEFPKLWSVGCLLAVNPEDREPWRLAGMDAPESGIQTSMASYLRGRYPELTSLEQAVSNRGLVTRAFLTVVAAAVPFDAPEVPGLGLGWSRWNSSDEENEEWSQQLTVAGDPPPGTVSAVRTSPDVRRLHELIDGTFRYAALLAARDRPGAVSVNDLHVPAGSAEWTVWYSDEFGRWGEGSTIPGDEPGRPLPPAPEVELTFVPGEVAGGTGPASAGSISIAVNLPNHFEPGMLPLDSLDLKVNEGTEGKAPMSGVFSVPVPVTSPGGGATVTVEASLTNPTGTGPPGTAELTVNDPRPPPPLTAARALTWTSRGGGAGGAELALSWPHQNAAAAYRVYVADEQAISGGAAGGGSRAKRATDLFDVAAQAGRDRYRLVTDPALVPPAGTQVGDLVQCAVPLPGGMTDVQFVRVVPVTGSWVEAPFHDSGPVPVAVPLPDVPPAPSLRVTANTDGTTTVEIHARGVDPALLTRLEPSAPQYRLRRATRAVGSDYAHEERSGDLQPGAAAGEWHATMEIPAATPFVETSWYAEVRYPPEPGVDGHPDLVLTNDRIRPTWIDAGAPMEMRWGPASLPVPSLYDPGPPAAPAATRHVEAGAMSVVVDPAPVAAARAVGTFRLAVWRIAAGAEPALVAPIDSTMITATPFRLDDPVGAEGYRVAVVDPLNRWSDAVEVD
jgi:hypothetical protein